MELKFSKWMKKILALAVTVGMLSGGLLGSDLTAEAAYITDPKTYGAINQISKYDYAIINNPVATYKLDYKDNFDLCPTNSNYVIYSMSVKGVDDHIAASKYATDICNDIAINHPELMNTDYTLRGYSIRDNTEVWSEGYASIYLTVIDENTTITIPSSIEGFPEEIGGYDRERNPTVDIYERQSGYDMSFTVQGLDGDYSGYDNYLFTELNTDPHKTIADSSIPTRRNDMTQTITISLADYMNRYDAFAIDTSVSSLCINNKYLNFGYGTIIRHYFVTQKGLQRMMDRTIDLPLAYFKLDDGIHNFTGMRCIDGTWRYLVDGNILYDYSGMACNEYGWWLFQNGEIDWHFTGLAWNPYGWWYFNDGKIDYTYCGLAQNPYGWCWVENGYVNPNRTGLVYDSRYGWLYIQNGIINSNYTGLVCDPYVGWWYVENGTVNFNATGLVANEYGWWFVQNGTINFNYTGLVPNEYGWWYVQNGAINFNYNGLAYDPYVGWWVVNNGAINFGYTGMIANDYGWWYAVNGALDLNATGWACNEYGWWLYYNGTIAWNYTGWWDGFYCVNGHLA